MYLVGPLPDTAPRRRPRPDGYSPKRRRTEGTITMALAYKLWKHSPTPVRVAMVGVGAYLVQRRVRRLLHEIL